MAYSFDDFGRMVKSSLPPAEGPLRLQYDAQGNVLARETEAHRQAKIFLAYAYDGLGRPTEEKSVSGSGIPLYRQGYDEDGTPPTGCSVSLDRPPSRTTGRLRYRQDSFGFTWYRYDESGRVVDEVRARDGKCGGDGFNDRRTSTTRPIGQLASVTYPYGRVVQYAYGAGALADRVSHVDVSFFDGTTWQAPGALLSGIVWEPYGGLRGYELHLPATAPRAAVEYMLGGDASQPPAGCTSRGAEHRRWRPYRPPAGDAGRQWHLLAGANGGDIYQRTYTWQADQVAQIDTCLLGATTPRTETYSYDGALRLTGAARPAGNADATGGAFTSRSYNYDGRGRRVELEPGRRRLDLDLRRRSAPGPAGEPDMQRRYLAR